MTEKLEINRVKTVLFEKKMTNREFAKLMNKTEATISRICNNEQQPSLITLRQMALALDVDISELLYRTKV